MLYPQTRQLLPFAIQRTTMEEITLVFSDKTFQDDGSFILDPLDEQVVKARIIALTSNELQRLRDGGVTINEGVSVSVIGELVQVPDYVKFEIDQIYRVVRYTFEQGVSIMIVDTLPGVI